MSHDEIVIAFATFGFPTWLVYPLAIAKILGVIMILTKFKHWLTEWAYAGIFFNVMLAISAHLAIKDGEQMGAIIGLILVLGSHATWKIGWKSQ